MADERRDGQASDGDLAARHGIAHQLVARDVPLLSTTQVQPDLEEIFLRLVGAQPRPGRGSRTAEAGRRQ